MDKSCLFKERIDLRVFDFVKRQIFNSFLIKIFKTACKDFNFDFYLLTFSLNLTLVDV